MIANLWMQMGQDSAGTYPPYQRRCRVYCICSHARRKEKRPNPTSTQLLSLQLDEFDLPVTQVA